MKRYFICGVFVTLPHMNVQSKSPLHQLSFQRAVMLCYTHTDEEINFFNQIQDETSLNRKCRRDH